jgi:hypothetical protein
LISHFLQIDKQVITLCKNEDVWDILKTIIQAVFPMLIVLRLADQKEAVMDKLYYYVRRMDITIERSKDTLNAAERRLNNSGLHMRTQHLNDENSDDDDNSEGSLDNDLLSDDDDNEASNKNDEVGAWACGYRDDGSIVAVTWFPTSVLQAGCYVQLQKSERMQRNILERIGIRWSDS